MNLSPVNSRRSTVNGHRRRNGFLETFPLQQLGDICKPPLAYSFQQQIIASIASRLSIDALVMAPLSEAKLANFARALSNVSPADCRPTFDELAAGENMTFAELDAEFQRLNVAMLRYRAQQRCIRLRVHRHYMSCAQEALWHKHAH